MNLGSPAAIIFALTLCFIGVVGWAHWAGRALEDTHAAARETHALMREEIDLLRAWWTELATEHNQPTTTPEPPPEPMTDPMPVIVVTHTPDPNPTTDPAATLPAIAPATVPQATALGRVDDLELARALAGIEDQLWTWRHQPDPAPTTSPKPAARKRAPAKRPTPTRRTAP